MPRQEYNISRQRSTKSAITINGLLTWRACRLRSLRLEEGNAEEHLADIAAIDRVLTNVLGFADIEAFTRDFRREALFRRGELYRMMCDVLREADRPLTTREITEIVLARKGRALKSGRQGKEHINRVRKVCQRIKSVERVNESGGCQAWRMQRFLNWKNDVTT